jgi:hypothetical protein
MNKFDELAKGMAQSTTRRQALKKFGVGLAGMALACFGFAGMPQGKVCKNPRSCQRGRECCPGYSCCLFPGGINRGRGVCNTECTFGVPLPD